MPLAIRVVCGVCCTAQCLFFLEERGNFHRIRLARLVASLESERSSVEHQEVPAPSPIALEEVLAFLNFANSHNGPGTALLFEDLKDWNTTRCQLVLQEIPKDDLIDVFRDLDVESVLDHYQHLGAAATVDRLTASRLIVTSDLQAE
jgi:hypothetical protein